MQPGKRIRVRNYQHDSNVATKKVFSVKKKKEANSCRWLKAALERILKAALSNEVEEQMEGEQEALYLN